MSDLLDDDTETAVGSDASCYWKTDMIATVVFGTGEWLAPLYPSYSEQRDKQMAMELSAVEIRDSTIFDAHRSQPAIIYYAVGRTWKITQ